MYWISWMWCAVWVWSNFFCSWLLFCSLCATYNDNSKVWTFVHVSLEVMNVRLNRGVQSKSIWEDVVFYLPRLTLNNIKLKLILENKTLKHLTQASNKWVLLLVLKAFIASSTCAFRFVGTSIHSTADKNKMKRAL